MTDDEETLECSICFTSISFRVPEGIEEALYVELGVTDDPRLLEAGGWVRCGGKTYCPDCIPEPPLDEINLPPSAA